MDLLQLRYFCEAAQCENFSRVAEKYFVPQSSISHTVARLEEELGAKLFTRSGKRVMLNEYGKAFYEEISAALSKIDRGTKRVADLRRGSVRLALREGTVAMIPLIAAFRKEHPEIEITFSKPSDRIRGNLFFDLKVGTRPFDKEEEFICEPLFTERILTAVSADSPLAKKTALTVDDIRGLPVIGLFPGTKMYRQMAAYFELHEYAPDIKIESENHATVAEFVKNGFGIAFFPEISWSAVQKDGIVSLPFADFDGKRTVYIAWQRGIERSAATCLFADFALRYFRQKST